MDKKEYAKAFDLIDNNSRSILESLVKVTGKNAFDTIEKIKNQLDGYEKAKTATNNLDKILKLVAKSDSKVKSVDPVFSRGLEYYTGFIFEVQIPELDISLGGGGRYDRLIELFGGSPTPAVGVAHGLDRINLALLLQGIPSNNQNIKRVFVIPVTNNLKMRALEISEKLRNSGIFVEFEVMGRKVGRSIQYASKLNMDYVVIVGELELKTDSVTLRDLGKHEQITIKIESLAKKIME